MTSFLSYEILYRASGWRVEVLGYFFLLAQLLFFQQLQRQAWLQGAEIEGCIPIPEASASDQCLFATERSANLHLTLYFCKKLYHSSRLLLLEISPTIFLVKDCCQFSSNSFVSRTTCQETYLWSLFSCPSKHLWKANFSMKSLVKPSLMHSPKGHN